MSEDEFYRQFEYMHMMPAQVNPAFDPIALPTPDPQDMMVTLQLQGARNVSDRAYRMCSNVDAPKWMQAIAKGEMGGLADSVAIGIYGIGLVRAMAAIKVNLDQPPQEHDGMGPG